MITGFIFCFIFWTKYIDYKKNTVYYHITVAWLRSGSAPAPMRWSWDYSSADHTAGARIEPPGSFFYFLRQQSIIAEVFITLL